METRLVFPALPNFKYVEGSKKLVVLEEDYAGPVIDGRQTIVKKGFVYDGASIPRLGWVVVGHPLHARNIGFATIHDAECRVQAYSREICDKHLLTACKLSGRCWFIRHAIYRAVRDWGWIPWIKNTPEKIEAAQEFVIIKVIG